MSDRPSRASIIEPRIEHGASDRKGEDGRSDPYHINLAEQSIKPLVVSVLSHRGHQLDIIH